MPIEIEGAKGGVAPEAAADARPVFVDAFAGCGGLSLGLKRAGWKGLFAIERDTFAFDTLDSNFPSGTGPLAYAWPACIPRQAWDIRTLLDEHGSDLAQLRGTVDLLAGGPPCQGFSHAGRRKHDDPRNKLFEAYLELVDILRPRLVLVENVRGFETDFRSGQDGSTTNYAAVLRSRLSSEYDLTDSVVRACDLGIPQVRPRFFLVGASKRLGADAAIGRFFQGLVVESGAFLARHGLTRSTSARDALSDLEVARNGTVACEDSPGFEAIGYVEPCSAYQRAMRGDMPAIVPSDTRLARHRPEIRERFATIISTSKEEGRLNVSISPSLREEHGLKKMAIRVLDPLRPAPTITSMPDDLLHYSEPRTLTVRENARLQSFPDWFRFKGKYTTGGHLRRKEVPRFTQVANAVPPLLAEQLGLGLRALLGVGRNGQEVVEGERDGVERLPLPPQPLPEA